MPIVIVLLSAIVAFLFGGPILGISVLLIGLIIVFPNIFGLIAAFIGVAIGLTLVKTKFGIDPYLIILIIIVLIVVFVMVVTFMKYLSEENYQSKRKWKEQTQEKVKKSIKALEDAKIICTLVDITENRTIKYSINPNTDSVWNALCDFLIYRRENAHNIMHDLKSLKIEYALTDEEIHLNRNEKEIFLILKNVKEPPYFVPHTKESKTLKNKNNKVLKSVEENVNDDLKNNHIDNLVKLSNLYKDGLITEQEYLKEKKKLLV